MAQPVQRQVFRFSFPARQANPGRRRDTFRPSITFCIPKMEGKMIESHLSYDLLPNADMKAYVEWVKNTVKALVEQPGVVEFRATRNVLGAPQVRATTVWQSLADWSKFTEGNVWQSMQTE